MAQARSGTQRAPRDDAGGRTEPASSIEALEAALKDSGAGPETFGETIGRAATALGGDLVFALPQVGSEDGASALVRFAGEQGDDRLVLVKAGGDGGISVAGEDEMEEGLARFGRASIAVLERLLADTAVTEPLDLRRH